MKIEKFFKEFESEIDTLLEEGVFIGLKEFDVLADATFTLLFDVAMYNIARRNNLTLVPEKGVRKGGRGGYSDITLYSHDGKEELIDVEHENKPIREQKGKRAIEKSIDNLMISRAKYKVLVTYTYQYINANELKGLCKDYLDKNYPDRNDFYLCYAGCYLTHRQNGSLFKWQII
ncbi:hypothetical protein HYU17_01170 [Candidatus Woesearchaeota archaeon]|nr:hypothetical protein [Candidatus Woesearchaeota archaeon]